jgi:hypothetical protein
MYSGFHTQRRVYLFEPKEAVLLWAFLNRAHLVVCALHKGDLP